MIIFVVQLFRLKGSRIQKYICIVFTLMSKLAIFFDSLRFGDILPIEQTVPWFAGTFLQDWNCRSMAAFCSFHELVLLHSPKN